ncbi:MAG: Asp-tRNA(Asn)/Glu-tRNA(Gln) amidotransferase subunit GatC [bacterium]|jgi:aspartyl-tRNA(Asn)/glutamyl-tRNA(Gln) amidotransferase subunit C
MKISREEVEHVANLARLRFDEGEMEKFTHQLNAILTYIDKLNELDTSGVEPTYHVLDVVNVFREDQVQPSLPKEIALGNAPERAEGFFKVPRIIE